MRISEERTIGFMVDDHSICVDCVGGQDNLSCPIDINDDFETEIVCERCGEIIIERPHF